MPRNNPYLTAWNKNIHNGVAACLLDNWVEERAIGEIEGPDAVLTIQNGKPQHRKNVSCSSTPIPSCETHWFSA